MKTKINHRSLKSAAVFLSFIGLTLFASPSFAQLTGTKNIPGDYATLAAAITDLNTEGVGAGGVTLNLIAGNPPTAPAGGYVVGGLGSLVSTAPAADVTLDVEPLTGNWTTRRDGVPIRSFRITATAA